MNPVRTRIKVRKGAAKVNHAHIMSKGRNCALIAVDMNSKRCEINATGGSDEDGPSIFIGANEHSLNLDESRRNVPTSVYFKDFVGWSIFCAEISRYTAYVALIKH